MIGKASSSPWFDSIRFSGPRKGLLAGNEGGCVPPPPPLPIRRDAENREEI